eukprot:5565687-Amphidinium_carterae.1
MATNIKVIINALQRRVHPVISDALSSNPSSLWLLRQCIDAECHMDVEGFEGGLEETKPYSRHNTEQVQVIFSSLYAISNLLHVGVSDRRA